ncbi:MAG: nicotinate-nucleotide adenylyltransferase [Wujia sp.]
MFTNFKNCSAIGLLGGTFNPVHNGHIMMAKLAYQQCEDIEKIVFLPNNKPTYKDDKNIVNVEHRMEMLKLATSSMDYAEISDIEIKRGGITYTIDTLQEMISQNKKLKIYMIIGADSLYTLDKWFKYREILQLCTVLVVSRNTDYEHMSRCADRLMAESVHSDIRILKGEEYNVSSSYIRNNIYSSDNIINLLPEGVYDYIIANELYK